MVNYLVISRNLPEKSPWFFKIRPMENPMEITMEIHHENLVKYLRFFTRNGDQNTHHLELRTRPGKSTKKKGVMAVDSSKEASMSKGGCSTKSWNKIWTVQ